MRTVLGVLAVAFVSQAYGSLLVTPKVTRNVPACCRNSDTLTCQSVGIDASLLGEQSIELPGGIEVNYLNNVGGNPNAFHYGGGGSDLIVSYNPSTGGIHGHTMTSTGKSYTIENCSEDGHVWKELDVANLGDSVGVDSLSSSSTRQLSKDLQVSADNTTMVYYSVKFYYTPQFAASTPDIDGFINQILFETNQGYANSQVQLTVFKHCSEQATINDQNGSDVLFSFARMKSSPATLRGSADIAVLLVNSFDYCGIGFINTIGSGNTLSVTKKSCAVGYYSFGHEVGHNIGLHHNPAVATNNAYPYATGHLITQGAATTGFRTIMAYYASGHRTRVNYYSNPEVIFPLTGTPTGIEGVSNNAALLNLNRAALAATGNEFLTCETTVTPTTTTTTTATTTTASGLGCGMENTAPNFSIVKRLYSVAASAADCQSLCQDEATCTQWAWLTSRKLCQFFHLHYSRRGSWVSGPKICESATTTSTTVGPDTATGADCGMENTRPSFSRVKVFYSIASAEDCQRLCQASTTCSRWAWSTYSIGTCQFYVVNFPRRGSWISGPKTC